MKKKILFIDSTEDILPEMLTKAGFECVFETCTTEKEIIKIIPDFTGIIIRSRILLNSDFLSLAKKLKFIGRVGAGMESIDVDFAQANNIACFNSPEGNRDAVGEHAIGMLLCLYNNLLRCNSEINKGEWNREKNRGVEIKGKTIGIIGFGNMGSSFAEKLKGFGCEIIAFDKYKKDFGNDLVKEVTISELFEKTDILSLHIPLTEETKFMVDDHFINKFKKQLTLINTSRGKIVKTNDLVNNLKTGKIKGACLDVLEFENSSFEMLDTSKTEDFSYLKKSDSVILSPHIAGWTVESKHKLATVLAKKIIEYGKLNGMI
jgi:D-3-phosphoglycerate dehydrogenase / 2-oxoglutarate reductase